MNFPNTILELDEKSLRAVIKSKSDLKQDALDAMVVWIKEIIENFTNTVDTFSCDEQDKLITAFEAVNLAIATLIADFDFSENDYVPFNNRKSAYDWLNGDNLCDCEPQYCLDENDWMLKSLWLVRNRLDEQIDGMTKFDKIRDSELFYSPPLTAGTLSISYPVYSLINALCVVWQNEVDADLGLPRRDANPDNPLLRFIDICLNCILGDERPAKKTILQIVQRHIRPELQDRYEYDQEQKKVHYALIKKYKGGGVDPFAFGPHEIVHDDS